MSKQFHVDPALNEYTTEDVLLMGRRYAARIGGMSDGLCAVLASYLVSGGRPDIMMRVQRVCQVLEKASKAIEEAVDTTKKFPPEGT